MRIKRLKLTGHRALQISVLPSGHEIRRFQLPGLLGRQLSREPLGGLEITRSVNPRSTNPGPFLSSRRDLVRNSCRILDWQWLRGDRT